MNTHNIGVRMQVVGGDKMKAEFAQIGQTGTRALKGIEGASKSSSFAMQNAAYQVGDFFVQVAGGQAPTRALAQQLPQLLGSFGLFGAIAGAAVAALVPLIGSLFDTAEEGEKLDDVLKDMASATKAYQEAAKASRVSVQELATTYGELADEIANARDRTEELTRAKAGAEISSGADTLAASVLGGAEIGSRASIAALDGGLDALIAKGEQLRDQLADVEPFSEAEASLTRQIAEVDAYIATLEGVDASVADLADRFGVTADEAARIADAAIRLRESNSVQESAEAADALAQELTDSLGSTEEVERLLPGIVDGLGQIVERAGDMTAEFSASADEAARIAKQFAAAQQRIAADGKVYSGRGGDPRMSNQQGVGEFSYSGPRLDVNNNQIPTRSSGGGGAARVDPRQREAERWFDRTRTSVERYAEELADLNELQKLGYLDAETYARAVKEIGESYGTASDQAKFWEGAQQELKDGLLDAIVSGKELSDVFEGLAKSIARAALEAALFGTGPFSGGSGGGGGGGLLGSLFGSIFGGFRASGGPVSAGSAYIVGERGPELFMPNTAGNVVPNNALGGGTTDIRVFVDQDGNWQAAVARIARGEASGVVRAGLGEYDRKVLPQSINRYSRDSRARG